ncbi:hypothetical protein L873DRAFT_1694501, partial [Choiromyces venosus 120613-1]
GVPENILFGKFHNGWNNEKIAIKYLDQNFGPTSQSAVKVGEEYQLPLFNGQNSHVNYQFLDYCTRYKIVPYCLLPHMIYCL